MSLKEAVQREFNRMITSSQPCAKCGAYKAMECSHIHSVGAYPNLRFDVMNVLPMDNEHHKLWHNKRAEMRTWFKKNYPGRHEYLLKAKNKHVGWTTDKLKEIRELVKKKDVKKLVIAPELFPLDKNQKTMLQY